MEILKEAQTVVNFASYYPLLNKATADNDTLCPGYAFEEIIKLSFQSAGHRNHLVDFLLSRLKVSACCGKQKVVNVLRHLTHKGHPEVRVMLRHRDEQLRALCCAGGGATVAGSSSNRLRSVTGGAVKTPQLLLQAAVHELLTELFLPELILADENRHQHSGPATPMTGLGSSISSTGGGGGGGSKYQGFGSMTHTQPTVVNKVRGLVERILWPSVQSLSPTAAALLHPSPGQYAPFVMPDHCLGELAPHLAGGSSGARSCGHPPAVTAADAGVVHGESDRSGPTAGHTRDSSPRLPTARVHVAGRPGGGWEEEDDDVDVTSLAGVMTSSNYNRSSGGYHQTPFDDDWKMPTLSPLPSLSPLKLKNKYRSRTDGATAADAAAVDDSFITARSVDYHDIDDTVQQPVDAQNRSPLLMTDERLGSSSSLRVNLSTSVTPDVHVGPNSTADGDGVNMSISRNSNATSHQREEAFVDEFLRSCGDGWPVAYETIMDSCKRCNDFDVDVLLHAISIRFGYDNNSDLLSNRKRTQNRDISNNSRLESKIPDDVSCLLKQNIQDPNYQDYSTASASCSLPFHHQMALLTLVDLCIHEDIFQPVLVKETLGDALEWLRLNDKTWELNTVAKRAKRLHLVIVKLAQLSGSRGA